MSISFTIARPRTFRGKARVATSFGVPAKLKSELDELSEESGRPLADLVIDAFEEALMQIKWPRDYCPSRHVSKDLKKVTLRIPKDLKQELDRVAAFGPGSTTTLVQFILDEFAQQCRTRPKSPYLRSG